MNYLAMALKVKTRGEIQDNPHGLIDRTLQEMNEAYKGGTLEWIKRSRPKDWKRMVGIEAMINEKALTGDIEGLRKALEHYQGFIMEMLNQTFFNLEEKTVRGPLRNFQATQSFRRRNPQNAKYRRMKK